MRILDILLIVFVFLSGYTYVMYPLVIRVLSKLFPRASQSDDQFFPKVSIIVAAHNEERVLVECLESLLKLDYPANLCEILVGSDGSTDGTVSIIQKYAERESSVKPFCFSERRGKIPVVNDLVESSSGDILYFTDADVVLSPNTLKAHVRHYSDPTVGAVAGAYHIHSAQSDNGLYESEKQYASVEQNIRQHESRFASSLGLSGANYSTRKNLWQSLPDSLVHDDLFVALGTLSQRRRVLYEATSVATDIFDRSYQDEFGRKVRSASRGYHTIAFFPKLLGFSSGRISFMLWSHKLLRWMSPLLIGIALLLAIFGFTTDGSFRYQLSLEVFFGFIVLALLGLILERQKIRVPVLHQLSWLVSMNTAYIVGTLRYIMHSDGASWTQAKRHSIPNPTLSTKEVTSLK
ncbi:MAG: glycosyltransferase [bacterium]